MTLPAVYGQIAAAFDELFEHADHDPTRPLIEFYRREGEVDCLVPVNAAVPTPEHSSFPYNRRSVDRRTTNATRSPRCMTGMLAHVGLFPSCFAEILARARDHGKLVLARRLARRRLRATSR